MPDLDLEKIYLLFIQYGMNVLAAVVIFIIGRWAAHLISNFFGAVLERTKVNLTLVSFAKHLAFYGIMTFVIIAALNKLGVETTSFIAVLGAASLAVGLALQGSLSNFASGVLLIVFHPFRVGDHIEAGGANGRVVEIQIFNTLMVTDDYKRIIVPNSKITADKIVIFPPAAA